MFSFTPPLNDAGAPLGAGAGGAAASGAAETTAAAAVDELAASATGALAVAADAAPAGALVDSVLLQASRETDTTPINPILSCLIVLPALAAAVPREHNGIHQ